MNKAFLVGRLTKPVELRTTPNGVSVATIDMAVNRKFKREETDYFKIIAWRGLADNCAKFLVKGQQIAVIGEIQNRSYEDNHGVKRYITEIHSDDIEFLAKPSGGDREDPHTPYEEDPFASEVGGVIQDDEELPF